MIVRFPFKCPHCRTKLTSKLSRLGNPVKWCRRCRCVVVYDSDLRHDDDTDSFVAAQTTEPVI